MELNNFSVSDENKNLFELNKRKKVARHNRFMFNQVNKLTIEFLFAFKIYKHKLLSEIPNTDVSQTVFWSNLTKSPICRKFLQ